MTTATRTDIDVSAWPQDDLPGSSPSRYCPRRVRPAPLERFSLELFGLSLHDVNAALKRIPPAEHSAWLDQRMADQGFIRDADGHLQWPRSDGGG